MKKLIFLLFPFALLAQEGIQFGNLTWEATLAEAKKTNKLVFMDAYATWCGPCKQIEKYTFTDAAVGEMFNASFINVRFDMEQYPGLELAERYEVDLYPTLLFINGDGELVHRGCGAVEPNDLIALGKEALDPASTLLSMKKAYDAGERSQDFMTKYLTALTNACRDVEGFVRNHLAGVPDAQLADDANWYLLRDYVADVYSREFLCLLKNPGVFEAKQDKNEVQEKIFGTFMMNYEYLAEADGFALFGIQSLKYLAEQHDFARKQELLHLLNFGLGELTEDWELYAQGAAGFMRPEAEDIDLVLDVAWKFYLFVEDKEMVLKALNWTKYLLDTYEPEPATIDTYASLLFKLGRKADAIKYEEQALQLAQSWGEDTQHYEFQLAKFKK